MSVEWSRLQEAQAITDALLKRLCRERREFVGAVDVQAERRVAATRVLLEEAKDREARALVAFERVGHAGRPVKGSRSVRNRQEVHAECQRYSKRPQRPVKRVASTSGKGDE